MSNLRARSKRTGFSPGAAARHSQHARVYRDFFQFFFCLPTFPPFNPKSPATLDFVISQISTIGL